jgi:hypothetical protein
MARFASIEGRPSARPAAERLAASRYPVEFRAAMKCLPVLVGLLFDAPASAASGIGGTYCGTAWSGGLIVEVVTTLTAEADGLLVGHYEFADRGEMTPGKLREYRKLSDGKRMLIWTDKYGVGQLLLQFNDSGDSFAGKWNSDLWSPALQWDGRRCDSVASDDGEIKSAKS